MADLTLKELLFRAHETAKAKGWWDRPMPIAEFVANVHREVSEALNEYARGKEINRIHYEYSAEVPGVLKPAGFTVELADALIRILDFAEKHGLPLDQALREKMAYNDKRPYRHGGKIV